MEKTSQSDLKIIKNSASTQSARNLCLTSTKSRKTKPKPEFLVARASVSILSNSKDEILGNSSLFHQNSSVSYEAKNKIKVPNTGNVI